MARSAMAERVGLQLGQARPVRVHNCIGQDIEPHQGLKIIRSICMRGDFPEQDAAVTFDFAGTGNDQMVHVISENKEGRTCALWSIHAVEDRDLKGLKGFKEFAESLGLKGAQLAHLIMGLRN